MDLKWTEMDYAKALKELYFCKYKTNTMKGLTFSLKRALGISGLKTKIARKTGIPTTQQGLQRKIGAGIIDLITGKKGGNKKR